MPLLTKEQQQAFEKSREGHHDIDETLSGFKQVTQLTSHYFFNMFLFIQISAICLNGR